MSGPVQHMSPRARRYAARDCVPLNHPKQMHPMPKHNHPNQNQPQPIDQDLSFGDFELVLANWGLALCAHYLTLRCKTNISAVISSNYINFNKYYYYYYNMLDFRNQSEAYPIACIWKW